MFISIFEIMKIKLNYVFFFLPYIIFLVLPTLYLLRKNKITWKTDLKINKISIKIYIYLTIIVILFQPIANGLFTVLSDLFNEHSIENNKFTFYSFIYFMIANAIITPIIEEIWYRGLLFQKTKHMGIYRATLLNGVIFGLAHQNIVVFSYTVLFGMLCCFVFHISKSLLAPIFLHFLNNAFQNIPENNFTEPYYQFISNPLYIVPFMVLLILFLYSISKKANKVFTRVA